MNRTIGKKGTVSFAQMKNALSGGVKKNNNQNSSSPKKDIDVTMDVRDVLGRIQKNPADSNGSRSTTQSASSKKSTIAMTSRTARESVVMPEQKNYFERIQEKISNNPVSSLDTAPKSISPRRSNESHSASPARMQEKKPNLKNTKSFMDVSDDEQNTLTTSVPKSIRSYRPEVKTAQKKSGKWQGMDGENHESSSSSAERAIKKSDTPIQTSISRSKSNLDSDSDSTLAFASISKEKGIVDFGKMKRTLTKNLSRVNANKQIEFAKKNRASNPRRKIDMEKILLNVPQAVRFKIAKNLYAEKATAAYKDSTNSIRNFKVQAIIKRELGDAGLTYSNELKDAFLYEVEYYDKKTIDLNDPVYLDHVRKAGEAEFGLAWSSPKVGDTKKYEKYIEQDKVGKIFARDFDHSNYFIKKPNGEINKIDSIEEYLSFTSNTKIADMSKRISIIASQTLGIFLRNAIFGRKSASHTRFEFGSALQLPDGTEVAPQTARGMDGVTTYTLEKKSDGSFLLEYTKTIHSNPNNPLWVTAYVENGKAYKLRDDAAISIYTPITIYSNGDWEFGDVEMETFNIEEVPMQQ